MIYLALKHCKYNSDVWSPHLPLSEGSVLLTFGRSRRFHAPRVAPKSWVFPFVLLAILPCRCTALVFLRFGTHDGLSRHEDEVVQAFLSYFMYYSIVLRPSYQTMQVEANFVYGRVKLFQYKFIRKKDKESAFPSTGDWGMGRSGFLFAIL